MILRASLILFKFLKMIKHNLIDKGSIAHCLISSINEPNKFIPVKVVIKDIKFDEYKVNYIALGLWLVSTELRGQSHLQPESPSPY